MALWASSCHQVTGCKLLSLQSSELIPGAINQTRRQCEPLNVFLDFLWLLARQCVNSPTLPTNHSHRATRRERRSARCFGILRTMHVFAVLLMYVLACAYVLQTLCVLLQELMVTDIRISAVFFPFLRACTIISQFESLHLCMYPHGLRKSYCALRLRSKIPVNKMAKQLHSEEPNEPEIPWPPLKLVGEPSAVHAWRWMKSSLRSN